jgi:hypothetical protein
MKLTIKETTSKYDQKYEKLECEIGRAVIEARIGEIWNIRDEICHYEM